MNVNVRKVGSYTRVLAANIFVKTCNINSCVSSLWRFFFCLRGVSVSARAQEKKLNIADGEAV